MKRRRKNSKLFLALIKHKNKVIRKERERMRSTMETMRVLYTYVGLLTAKCGVIRVPDVLVQYALGKYSFKVSKENGFYTVRAVKGSEYYDMLAKHFVNPSYYDDLFSEDEYEEADASDTAEGDIGLVGSEGAPVSENEYCVDGDAHGKEQI